ncbi:MAG: transporter substrate-binding domain-containing protein [Candidatus Riflebacteria bacterium]|nr:transporter substrate-binding domain-containing protein [Candidatus Riflebacteria bacterium]
MELQFISTYSGYRGPRFPRACGMAIMLFCLLAIFFAEASVNGQELSQASMSPILSASEVDYPPFCLLDKEGRAAGFSVELLQATVRAMGRDITFRTGPWDEVKTWLTQGNVQVLPLVGRTPEREALFDFTFPYIALHGAIVVRKDSSGIRNLQDLKGRRVAVMKGDNAEEFLRREERGIEIHTTTTFQEALRELSQGHYDAVVIQRLVGLRLIKETGITNLRIINRPIDGFRQDFCFAVKDGDRETLALLNEGLALVLADGTYDRLHARWFASLELPTQRRLLIGGDSRNPPWEYLDENGRPTGYNVELTRAIAQEAGLDVEIRLGVWSEMVQELENNEIDALAGVFYSLERGRMFDFSPAHIVNRYVAVVRSSDGPPPETIAELDDKHLVLKRRDIMEDCLTRNGHKERVSTVDSEEDALEQLASGKHDCALVPRITALNLIKKHGWTNLALSQRSLLSQDYCFAVGKGQKDLMMQLSEGLKTLEKTGEYRRIRDKWLGMYDERGLDSEAAFRLLGMIGLPVFLVLAASFAWSWSLRRQVANRTDELRQVNETLRVEITEHKKTEEGLRLRSEIMRNLSEGVCFIRFADAIIVWANPKFETMFGYHPDELIGKDISIVNAPDEKTPEEKKSEILSALSKTGTWHGEIRNIRKDGSPFDCYANVSLFEHPDYGKIMVTIHTDITDRKRAEAEKEKLEVLNRQLQKSESLSRMAGAIAHHFNNQLQALSGNLELALDCIPSGMGKHVEFLTNAMQATHRASAVSSQMLTYLGQATSERVPLDLTETCRLSLPMLQATLPRNVELQVDMPSPGPVVSANTNHLSQVLVNLVTNAWEACDQGQSVIHVSVKTVLSSDISESHRFPVNAPLTSGAYACLEVKDTGCGIAAKDIGSIFDPFFSSKFIGRGMGLPVVLGIVRAHDGAITVESETCRGSIFRVYLPLSSQEVRHPLKSVVQAPMTKEVGTILVVDDEEMIRDVTAMMLSNMGFTARTAKDGVEAIEVFRQHQDEIRCVLCDLTMPRMDGWETLASLRKIAPDIPVILASGYNKEQVMFGEHSELPQEFLRKPYRKDQLTEALRHVLAGASG